MAEQHPAEEVLLDLALGDIGEPDREQLERHLSSCSECRARYNAAASTLDQTLTAAPRIQPPPGFDQRVLAAMGLAPVTPTLHVARRPWHRRPLFAAAAACLVGVALGVGGSVVAGAFDDDPPASVAAPGVPLVTRDGQAVGTASFSYLDGQPVLVVAASGGKAGMTYECRLRLADGSTSVVGEWVVPEEGATWVVPAPQTPAVGIDLVAETGRVWSTADLS